MTEERRAGGDARRLPREWQSRLRRQRAAVRISSPFPAWGPTAVRPHCRSANADAADRRRVRRARHRSGRRTVRRSTSSRRASPEPYYDENDADLYACRRRAARSRRSPSIDGSDRQRLRCRLTAERIAFVGTLRGTPIRSYSQSGSLGRRRRARQHAEEPDRATTTSTSAAASAATRRRRAGRTASRSSGRRTAASLIVVVRRKRQREPEARLDRDRQGRAAHRRRARRRRLQRDARRIEDRRDASRRRPTSATSIVDGAGPRSRTRRWRRRSRASTTISSRTSSRASPKRSGTRASTASRSRAGSCKPPDFDASKKYPLILEIHGGPHSAYGNTFTHEFQWMAAKGYVVLFTNPRGSTHLRPGLRQRHPVPLPRRRLQGPDGRRRRGAEARLRRRASASASPAAAAAACSPTGRSRRRSASRPRSSQRAIADWSGFWYTADFTLFTPTWFRKAPWEDPQDFAARSPITHVAKVKTPLMLVDGDADYRTPPARRRRDDVPRAEVPEESRP